ncbi:hypothetical protein DAPPUDRAFT_326613 [Daphnia pulex]|uniref:Uncharacterized protein n=1 Tax=Daphnia pulex TaxID=6669 RepID=E9H898_DAPPU|nr:hypothetical protein DAPPUDRAFT_326613 [Daphnia pulex]|eukprot:EFX72034.1 hypothetical protein DAPPUDRAFT_326613 [Daphnia pulex]
MDNVVIDYYRLVDAYEVVDAYGLVNQLARDAGVELLIFMLQWEVVQHRHLVKRLKILEIIEFFLLDIRQNPAKANVNVENEEPQTENVELNKEKEIVRVHVSHTGSEGDSVEPTNKESEAGGVESSNKESFEPESEHFPLHLIPGTQHPSKSKSDGTCRTGASNVAASELPVPAQNEQFPYRVQQHLQSSSIQHRRHLIPLVLKPVEFTTMTASNPSSFLPVTLSETQVLISSPSPPVSVVTIRSETPELPTPETGQ